MELIQHLCERDIFKHQQNKTNSLENLASKQRIFRIVKEQHGFMLTVRSKDCSVAGFQCADFRTISTSHPCVPGRLLRRGGWWSQPGSNRRPRACKARALPAELWPLLKIWVVGLGGVAPPTSPLSGVRSN
jgi:hypothetical protein